MSERTLVLSGQLTFYTGGECQNSYRRVCALVTPLKIQNRQSDRIPVTCRRDPSIGIGSAALFHRVHDGGPGWPRSLKAYKTTEGGQSRNYYQLRSYRVDQSKSSQCRHPGECNENALPKGLHRSFFRYSVEKMTVGAEIFDG